MSIESVMPSKHLILCRSLLLLPSIFPSIRVISNESALHIRWPRIGVSASTSVLPINTQDWSPLGWTGWISLQSKGLSKVFSNTTVQKHQFFWSRSQNLFLFRLEVCIMNNIPPFLLPPANIFLSQTHLGILGNPSLLVLHETATF